MARATGDDVVGSRKLFRTGAQRSIRRWLSVVVATTVTLGSLVVAGPSGAKPTQRTSQDLDVPSLDWSSCYGVFQCATAEAPLDYDEPQGKTIELALIRKPANDQEQRIGSLFVHPGGPGNAITSPLFFAPTIAALGPKVQDRFDVIGVDPRGTGGSAPVTCRPAPHTEPVTQPVDTYPTEGQYEHHFAYDEYVRKSCAATAGPILDHMSTADSARDLNLIRQSVGDEQLTFYGVSYGAILGQTYAAMFPERVRAIAVDGVFDPQQWATGDDPPFRRTRSGEGTAEAVNAALERCDEVGPSQCSLAGNAETRWQRVRDSLAQKPIEIAGVRLNDKSFVDFTEAAVQLDQLSGMPVATIEPWLRVVTYLDVLRFGAASTAAGMKPDLPLSIVTKLQEAVNKAGTMAEEADGDPVGAPARVGVWCADTENPDQRRSWIEAGKDAETAASGFGPAHTWITSVCANWPGSTEDSFHGPFDVRTSAPLLMAGLTHDSTTPIAGAYSAADRFPGSRVVEVRSWGHTSLGKSDRCLQPITDAYLLHQQLPDKNVTCQPDHGLFDK